MTTVLFLLACWPKAADVPASAVARPIVVGERPSGVVFEGTFTDEMHAFFLPVAEGWVAKAGPEVGLMRVAMEHVATGTLVEVWAFPGSGVDPHVREGCVWTFQSKGRPLSYTAQSLVATCVPSDAQGRRVYGVVFERAGTTFQIEVQPPNDALLEGRSMAEALLMGLSW